LPMAPFAPMISEIYINMLKANRCRGRKIWHKHENV